MSNKNSAETQEDVGAYLDEELSDLPVLPIHAEPVRKASNQTPKPSHKAAFDAKLAADKARNKDLDQKAKAARTERETAVAAAALKARKARNQGARRARQQEATATLTAPTLLAVDALDMPERPIVDGQVLAIEATALAAWLATRGRSQGGLRKVEQDHPGDLMRSREVQLLMLAEFGAMPSWQTVADRLSAATGRPWSREQARRRHDALTRLEASDGPWDAR